MNLTRGPLVWGILLVLGGLLLLAQNLGLLGEMTGTVWVIVLALGSIAFFAAYVTQRRAWWFLFPAFVLAGLVATILLSESQLNVSGLRGDLAGSVFLWSIALAFWGVYLSDSNQWWAIIPAGVMTTIGAMPLVATRVEGTSTGAILFLGIGLTFGILYLLRARHSTGWAVFPAAACLGMALLLGVLGPFDRFWPIIFLIVPGVYLLYQALRPRASRGPG
jgi:hypothetical protein